MSSSAEPGDKPNRSNVKVIKWTLMLKMIHSVNVMRKSR